MPATEIIDVDIEEAVSLRLHSDPHLTPYRECIRRRLVKVIETQNRITGGRKNIAEFASGPTLSMETLSPDITQRPLFCIRNSCGDGHRQ